METFNRSLFAITLSILLLALLLAGMLVSPSRGVARPASNSITTRVSVATGGAQASDNSFEAAISADERYVAFSSGANNLVGDDANGAWDVFIHDRQTGQTERVSVASDGSEGNGNSTVPAISADGRYVAFESIATTLVATDTNTVADVFVHDRQTHQTVRVSINSDGMQGNGASGEPAISADGRFVAFESTAANLVGNDFNYQMDVFVHDRDADEDGVYDESGQIRTVRVSVSSTEVAGNGASGAASISADGRFVAFASSANNLVTGDGNGFRDVFLHDRDTDRDEVYDEVGQVSTTLISRAHDGTGADDQSGLVAISADGGTVVFESFATNLIAAETSQFNQHVFAHDVHTGHTTLVSIASDGNEGNDWSHDPDVSADGRYVAFSSNADNLVADDGNYSVDIFLHDRDVDQDGYFDEAGQVSTVRVNVASDGTPTTNGQSALPALSDDGQATAFESADSTLAPGDSNFRTDIFVHDQTPPSGADLFVEICCGGDYEISELWPYPQIRATFAVSVTNNGPETAHNVVLDFVGEPTVVYTPTEGTCEPDPTGKCDYGTLAPGETVSVTVEQYGWPYDWQALYQGSVGAMASATADEADLNPANDRAHAVVHYYICDNAHDCILAKAFCRLLIHGWRSRVEGSSETGVGGVSLASKLRAAADYLPHLPLYYDVRDKVLATPDGWPLIDLYDTHSNEIYDLMENDQALRYQGIDVLETWEPNLQALVDGNGSSVIITAKQVQDMDNFLTSLSAAGSPALQQAIADERSNLGDLDNFIGLTMEEARGIVVGYIVYLPLVQKP